MTFTVDFFIKKEMADVSKVLKEHEKSLLKALIHLAYSYQKVQNLQTDIEELNEEDLETWEGFSARFARASEIFVSKYLRTLILRDDPSFEGSLRDLLNRAEKLNYITDVEQWLEIRGIRNVVAHDYTDEDLEIHFRQLKKFTPLLLELKTNLPQ